MEVKNQKIDYTEPFDKIAGFLRGVVVEAIDAVFIMAPEILKQDKEVQSLLIELILSKLNAFFKHCLRIISDRRIAPKSYATDDSFSSIYNFLIILIDTSQQLKVQSDEKSLLRIGGCVCEGAFNQTGLT